MFSTVHPYKESALLLVFGENFVLNKSIVNILPVNGLMAFCAAPPSSLFSISDSVNMYPTFTYSYKKVIDGAEQLFSSSLQLVDYGGVGSGCINQNNCSGHGVCDYCHQNCVCDSGWGSRTDLIVIGRNIKNSCKDRKFVILSYLYVEVSLSGVCPVGKAISDLPISPSMAHRQAECSNRGACNRQTGTCECYPPYTGPSCSQCKCHQSAVLNSSRECSNVPHVCTRNGVLRARSLFIDGRVGSRWYSEHNLRIYHSGAEHDGMGLQCHAWMSVQ